MGDLIDPTLAGWNFAERERELFASAKNIPTWRLANQARRFLAAVVHELSHARSAPLVKLVDDLDAGSGRELAVLDLGAVTVRATGSIIVLIGCGCEREAMGQGRTLVEAVIRAWQRATTHREIPRASSSRASAPAVSTLCWAPIA